MDDTQNIIQDIWENHALTGHTIVESAESDSEVDGVHILARSSGPAFFPGTVSRNKVYYPLEAWEKAISDPKFVQRLEARLVYGTIGHDSELSDNDIRDGKFSHIVTKVWIDENNVGQAEYLVVNTEPGKVLNTLLRIKSKLRVSTKAAGFFEPTSRDGSKSIIPGSFNLERIDFVTNPGYLNALPELLESLNIDTQTTLNKEQNMDNTVQTILESRIEELKTNVSIVETAKTELTNQLTSIKESNATAVAILEGYKAIGTAAAINEAYAELAQYRSLGTVQEIHEAFEKGEETIDTLTDTVSNLKTELEDQPEVPDVSGYEEVGSPEEVKDALDQALQIADELQKYRDLGSVEELSAVVDNAGLMTETLENQEKEAICAKFGVTPEVLAAMFDKGMSLSEASELLSQIKGAPASGTTTPVESVTTEPVVDTPATPEVPAEDPEKPKDEDEVNESLSSRLLRTTSRAAKAQDVNESATKTVPTTRAGRLMATRR